MQEVIFHTCGQLVKWRRHVSVREKVREAIRPHEDDDQHISNMIEANMSIQEELKFVKAIGIISWIDKDD